MLIDGDQIESKRQVDMEQFLKLCEEARAKYSSFEENIKKAEQKITGSVTTMFDLEANASYAKFVAQKLDVSTMNEFIRAEFLNCIVQRKKYVKKAKEDRKSIFLGDETIGLIEEETPGNENSNIMNQVVHHDDMMSDLRSQKKVQVELSSQRRASSKLESNRYTKFEKSQKA